MTLPSISIVTPSLDQGRFIRTTIRSVLDQAYPRLEYLVVDGGSRDETCTIVREFLPRVTLICEQDEGQSDAINKGFARTSGEVIGWLNSDDYYAPGTLQRVAEVFAADPNVGLVYGNVDWVGERGEFLAAATHVEPFDLDRLMNVCNLIVQPAAFFRRSAFDAVGGLRKELHWTMDYDLWIRLGQHGRVRYLPERLAYVRCYAGTKTASGGRRRLAEVERMIAGHGGRGLPAFFRLEAAALDLQEAAQRARGFELGGALTLASRAFRRVASSRRTMATLASPHTWRVIRTTRARDARYGKAL